MLLKSVAIGSTISVICAAGAIGGTQSTAKSLQATLTGKVEVPKGDLDGSGAATVTITGTKFCWEIDATKVAPLVAVHMHKGRLGVAGPVVVALGKTYKPKGCVTTTPAVAEAIKKTPKAYYVNVHNAKYPDGALRGQLVPTEEAMR